LLKKDAGISKILLKIRSENPSDYIVITKVNDLAFGQPNEGKLVENLRKNPKFIPELSFAAEIDGKIAGHILFFLVVIKLEDGKQKEMISLPPLAVLPEFQRQGIGGELIGEGIKACQRLGYDSIILLGHPEYYPKFGFRQANSWGIIDPFGAPIEAFMAMELKKGSLEDAAGTVEYPDEFLEV
jgi:putative acetyltransferase